MEDDCSSDDSRAVSRDVVMSNSVVEEEGKAVCEQEKAVPPGSSESPAGPAHAEVSAGGNMGSPEGEDVVGEEKDGESGEEEANEEAEIASPAHVGPDAAYDNYQYYDDSGGFESSDDDEKAAPVDDGFRLSVMKTMLGMALREMPAHNVDVTFGGPADLPGVPGLVIDGSEIVLPLNDVDGERLYSLGDVSPHGRGFETVIDPSVRSSREFKAVSGPTDSNALARHTPAALLISSSPCFPTRALWMIF